MVFDSKDILKKYTPTQVLTHHNVAIFKNDGMVQYMKTEYLKNRTLLFHEK